MHAFPSLTELATHSLYY